MKQSLSIGSEQQVRQSQTANNRSATSELQSFVDNRPQTIAQRQLINTIHASPQVIAQSQQAGSIYDSSRMAAQRELSRSLQSPSVQLQAAPEEEMLQGKFETVQRVKEDEELLQGKFSVAQRVKEEEPLQGKFDAAQRVEEEELLQGKSATETIAQRTQQSAEKPNYTGLPDNLKSGIEHLAGMSMDHVKVHYNFSQPAQLNALAYAQGADIHVAPGQEQHLPHEAWHVVQQAQGRVKPTMQMKDGVPINDDKGLEHEADEMGAKALAPALQLSDKLEGEQSLQSRSGTASLKKFFPRVAPKQFTHENIVQRVLSPLPGKSSGFLKGKRDKINTLIVKYNKLETKPNSKDERNKLLDDITILILNWERSVIKKKAEAEKSSQSKETNRLQQKLAEIEAFKIQVDKESEILNGKIEAKLEKTDSEVKAPTVETVIKEKSSSLEDRHKNEIIDLLRTAGYSEIQSPYMMKSYKTELPHVGWKAHIGATQETAVSVLKKVIPVFNELMVPNKVDWTLAVFGKTNKFITIYPPKDEGIWQSLIQALEGEVGHQMVHVEGELPVGKMGRVGMRHGQLTALTRGILDKNHIKYEELSLKSIRLTDQNQYDITIKDGVLMIENGGAFFGEHAGFEQKFPGMVYNGKVCLDPRQQPNPYDEPLPKGVITAS